MKLIAKKYIGDVHHEHVDVEIHEGEYFYLGGNVAIYVAKMNKELFASRIYINGDVCDEVIGARNKKIEQDGLYSTMEGHPEPNWYWIKDGKPMLLPKNSNSRYVVKNGTPILV